MKFAKVTCLAHTAGWRVAATFVRRCMSALLQEVSEVAAQRRPWRRNMWAAPVSSKAHETDGVVGALPPIRRESPVVLDEWDTDDRRRVGL